MRYLFIFLFLFAESSALAQEDDYFQSENSRKERFKAGKLAGEKFPNHEKLTLQVFANVSYSQINDMYGLFNQANGGIGGDAGLGIKVRIFKKLSFTAGGFYSNRFSRFNYNIVFTSGLPGEAELAMRTEYLGFYGQVLLDFSRRFWLGIHFEKGFQIGQNMMVEEITPTGSPTITWPDLFILSFPYGLKDQFDVGVKFGLNFPVLYPASVRPFLGIQIGTAGIFRTNEYGPTFPLGQEGELNPSFLHLRLGAIIDIPLLPVKPGLSNLLD